MLKMNIQARGGWGMSMEKRDYYWLHGKCVIFGWNIIWSGLLEITCES